MGSRTSKWWGRWRTRPPPSWPCANTSVDVIILDLQLKEGTGFGVMQRLGDTRPTIIVFTNYMLPEYQRLARDYGVEYFLNKSVDYERLPQLLEEIGAARPN